MNSVKVNTLANYAGTAWSFGLGICFTGVYFHMLGASNYGLVGIAQTLQMLMQAGDIGLSASAGREMARATADYRQKPLIILRTLGLLNASMAALVALLLWISTPWLVANWINVGSMDSAIVRSCLRWAVLMLAFQAVASFYSAALMGLQRQLLVNGLNGSFQTLRHFGTWAMLAILGPTIGIYFAVQTVVTALNAVVLCCTAGSIVRVHGETKWFDKAVLARCWSFGFASAGTTILGILVSQLDRLILAKYLSLGNFGIYSLAANIAAYVSRATSPLIGALYPRFTQLVEAGDRIGLDRLYSRSCAYTGLITLPVALCFAFMSTPILVIFTGSQDVAPHAGLLLTLLATGAALSPCSNMAYCVQQAHGNQLFALKVSLACLFTYSPLLYLAINRWGALGAAAAWLLLNTINFIIYPTYSTLRYFPNRGFAVYWTGLVLPLLCACVPFIAAYFIPWQPSSRTGYALYCATATAMAYVCIIVGYFCFFKANPLAGLMPATFTRKVLVCHGGSR